MFDGIFGYIIGGAIIGILARLFKPGADAVGWIVTLVIGILGAVVGGMLAGGGLISWIVAIVAAVVLLYLYEKVRARRPVRRT